MIPAHRFVQTQESIWFLERKIEATPMPNTERPRSKAFQRAPERPTASAYVTALTMLSRRELSEKQIRDRLKRRQHDSDEIDEAEDEAEA